MLTNQTRNSIQSNENIITRKFWAAKGKARKKEHKRQQTFPEKQYLQRVEPKCVEVKRMFEQKMFEHCSLGREKEETERGRKRERERERERERGRGRGRESVCV